MTNLKNEKHLHEKVMEWLETQGYDTEMKTAMIARNSELDTIHTLYYEDPETKISREIDIVARITDEIGILNIYSVIDCKKSQKPWVAFTSESGLDNRITSFSVTSDKTQHIVADKVRELKKIDWFRKDNRIAHGVTEAFTTKDDVSFKAGISATKASIALTQIGMGGDFGLNFFFPTVVLDGKLFECYLDEQGNSILNEINSVFLKFQVKFGELYGSSVHIVTLEFFHEYCKEFKNTHKQLKEVLIKERKDIANKLGINLD